MPTCPFCAKSIPAESSICPHCLRGQPLTPGGSRPGPDAGAGRGMGSARPVFLVVVLLGLGGYFLRNTPGIADRLPFRDREPEVVASAAPAPVVQTTIAPPIEVPIGDSSAVKVEPGKYAAYPFSGDGRAGCRVRGSVRATGGDRRVNVLVVDREGLAELEGGRTPRPFFESGASSDIALDFNVDGRTSYTLVVTNLDPRARTKTVRLRNVVAACAD